VSHGVMNRRRIDGKDGVAGSKHNDCLRQARAMIAGAMTHPDGEVACERPEFYLSSSQAMT